MDWQTEAIINSLDDAIVTIDETQRIVFLNDAAAGIFGCDRHQAAGQELHRLPTLLEAWGQLKLGEWQWTGESTRAVRRIAIQRSSGEAMPAEASISRTSVSGHTYFTAVMRDISLQQQMENAVALARKHQAVGALASGIAHDFNNILTAIISQVDLALYSPDCPASLKANLNYAQASARRGAELVAKLQMFSRQTKPKMTPLNLSEVVEQVIFVLRHSVDPRIEISFVPPPNGSWLVKADISQTLNALVNLGLNARDAMPAGGKLIFGLENITFAPVEARPPRKPGEFVKLTIADTGRGMSPETLIRLFEPYFSTKDRSQGLGLGLSITFSVVAEHGGWIEADSRLGKGSQFHVYLPRARETVAVATPKEESLLNLKSLEGHERILIVDDEESVRMVIRAVLAYRGYQIVEAEDGADAIQKFAQASPPIDLVLMDLHMPKMNGRDALLQIRQKNPRVKAVLLSGGLQDQEPDNSLELEGVRFLQKPFDNQHLVAIVRESLNAT